MPYPVYSGGKLYQMPWSGSGEPSDKDVDTFLASQIKINPTKPKQDTSLPKQPISLGGQATPNPIFNDAASAAWDVAKGFGNQLSDYARAVYGGNSAPIAASSLNQVEGIKDQWKKSNEVGPVEGTARKIAIPLDVAGIPVTQTADDIISGNTGAALIHGAMSVGGGAGLGRMFEPKMLLKVQPINEVPKLQAQPQVKPESFIPESPLVPVGNSLVSPEGLKPKPTPAVGRYGIVNKDINQGNPLLNTVPRSLHPPSPNEAVFNALVPESLGRQTPYKSPDAVPIQGVPPNPEVPSILSPIEKNAEVVNDVVAKKRAKLTKARVEASTPKVETKSPTSDELMEVVNKPQFKSKRLQSNPGLAERLKAKLSDETGAIGDIDDLVRKRDKLKLERIRAEYDGNTELAKNLNNQYLELKNSTPEYTSNDSEIVKERNKVTKKLKDEISSGYPNFSSLPISRRVAIQNAYFEAKGLMIDGDWSPEYQTTAEYDKREFFKGKRGLFSNLKNETGAVGKDISPITKEQQWTKSQLDAGYDPKDLDKLKNSADMNELDISSYKDADELAKDLGVKIKGLGDPREQGVINRPELTKEEEIKARGLFSNLKNERGSIGRNISPLETENRKAFTDFVNAKRAAQVRGEQFSTSNPDLKNLGFQGVLDYQKGDRSGPLSTVEPFHEAIRKEAVDSEILKPNQRKGNYFKQYWNEGPEVISRVKKSISKTASYAKTSRIKDYQTGINSGKLTPKYDNPADIMGAYLTEHGRAMANKELYNYLLDTNQVKTLPVRKGKVQPVGIDNMSNWQFKGPHTKQWQELIETHFEKPTPWLKKTADLFAFTKNINLAGGVPGTIVNAHGLNIANSDFQARGALKSLKSFAEGNINRKAEVKWMDEHKGIIPELIEKGGYEHGLEGHDKGGRAGFPLRESFEKTAIGRGVNKAVDFSQKWFEDPLFRVHLPVNKLKFVIGEDGKSGRLGELMKKGLSRDEAIKIASNDSNIFYGGINKALRGKTTGDLLRMSFLAPDWKQSRLQLAGKKLAAVTRTVAGKARPEDSLYVKAAGRGLAPDVLSKAIKLYGAKTLYDMVMKDNPSQITNLPLGETSDKKKTRSLDLMGTASDELKIPEQVGAALLQGNPGYLFRIIKNQLSSPAQTITHLFDNQDAFGAPIYDKDRYGRHISFDKAVGGIANELTTPLKHQYATALADLYLGKSTPEEAISQGAELPIKYNWKSKPSSGSRYR